MPSGNGHSPKRFAALIRVSTEQQEKSGESLRTQRTQIEHAVTQLGGTVVGWYGGQEHATQGHEKKEIRRLLDDASKDPPRFDAIMVTSADRWSRDNFASRTGLDQLKSRRVRFFVLSQEHDLFDPSAEMYLEMSAVIGGYQAKLQRKKSLESRIHRARRGLPACGKRPFGRIFDPKTQQWSIEPEKQQLIQDVARRYLAGDPIPKIAEELGMNHSSLHKTLTKRCGDTWEQTFEDEEVGIRKQTILTPIPPLLPKDTIEAILEKVVANKTYRHGQLKNRYLLGRMVICAKCGYAMFGQTNRRSTRYYRHAHTKRLRPCKGSKGWAPADVMEDAVLRRLFDTFGNPAAVERAMKQAVPDLDAAKQLHARLAELDRLIVKEQEGRQNVLELVRRGRTSMDDADDQLQKAQENISRWQQERERLAASVANVPTATEMRETARHVASRFKRMPKSFVRANATVSLVNTDYSRMTWNDKRELLQLVFSGKTPDGRRAGLYLEWPEGKGGSIRYTINGIITETGLLRKDAEAVGAGGEADAVTKSALRCRGGGLP